MCTRFVVACCFALQLQAGVFQSHCVVCHEELDVGIDKFFYRYVLVFSSELAVKAAIKDYLMHPMKEKSVLQEGLLEKYGIKEPSPLPEKELEEAIDAYWEAYSFIGRLE